MTRETLRKYLNGDASDAERMEVLQYFDDNDTNCLTIACSEAFRKVHETGMKYIVWYGVPFIGWSSEAYKKFEGKFLYTDWGNHCAVLDPRFPEVRDHLVNQSGHSPGVQAAIHRSGHQTIRQYAPGRKLPGKPKDNRMRIASLRLTSGSTPVHSDMLEWNRSETPENVGRAIINSIFGVIQYSAMLKNLPEEHIEVMRRWMEFAARHRETLLKSDFRPHHPELGYPVIEAESDTERIVAVYQDNAVIEAAPRGKRLYILNASGSDSLVVRLGNTVRTVKVPCGDWKQI